MAVIRAASVLVGDGFLAPGEVEVDGGRIVGVRAAGGPIEHGTLTAGFVDLQVNGLAGVDVGTADGGDWARIGNALLDAGVTTWCPTLTSRPRDEYGPALERAAAAAVVAEGPAIAGVHLEGPFLAPERAGAHPAEALAPLDAGWLSRLPDVVRLVTLAPELEGALDAVRALAGQGRVVALGHSAATAEVASDAAGAGARLVTHLFNAMAPFHHRQPGLMGQALIDDRLAVSLIADLEHVSPAALALAFRAKGASGVVLVSDSVADRSAALAEPVTPGAAAPRLGDGTLAGSRLTLDRAVANVVGAAGVSLDDALTAASSTPASVLGLSDRGRVEVGRRADLVALDDNLDVAAVWLGGERVR